jgi:beta-lactamase regulating signal transducer with metallopeptidase domain
MLSLSGNAWLEALGYAIVHSLWQFAALWLLCTMVVHLPKLSAAAKYRFGLLSQLLGFAWFVQTFAHYLGVANNRMALLRELATDKDLQVVLTGQEHWYSNLINWLQEGIFLLPYLAVAYLLVLAALLFKFSISYRQVRFLQTSGLQKPSLHLRIFVERIAHYLDISRKVNVFVSEWVQSPMTIGYFKPIILLPIASVNNLSVAQIEAVLLHEMAHIKRHDYLVNLLCQLIETVLFFNPFFQLIGRTVKLERENCCDDWVVQFQYQPIDYASALLSIAQAAQLQPALAMKANGQKRHLLKRVQRLVDNTQPSRFNYKAQLLSLLLLTAIVSLVGWYEPQQQQSNKPQPQLQIVQAKSNDQSKASSIEIPLQELNALAQMVPSVASSIEEVAAQVNAGMKEFKLEMTVVNEELNNAASAMETTSIQREVTEELACAADEVSEEAEAIAAETNNASFLSNPVANELPGDLTKISIEQALQSVKSVFASMKELKITFDIKDKTKAQAMAAQKIRRLALLHEKRVTALAAQTSWQTMEDTTLRILLKDRMQVVLPRMGNNPTAAVYAAVKRKMQQEKLAAMDSLNTGQIAGISIERDAKRLYLKLALGKLLSQSDDIKDTLKGIRVNLNNELRINDGEAGASILIELDGKK